MLGRPGPVAAGWVALLLGAGLLAGCQASDGPPEEPSGDASSDAGAQEPPVLSLDEAAALMDDYGERYDEVSRAAETGDERPGPETVLTGPELADRLADDRGSAAADAPIERDPIEFEPIAVYGGDLTASPQWVVVGAAWDSNGSRDAEEGQGHSAFVFERSGDDDPWHLAQEVGLGSDSMDLPLPVEDGGGATDEQIAAGDDITADLAGLFRTGEQPESVSVGQDLRYLVDQTRAQVDTDLIARTEVDANAWSSDSTRVVPIAGGALVITTVQVDVTLFAKPGRVLFWRPPLDAVWGTDRGSRIVASRQITSAAWVRESGGTASYLGDSDGLVDRAPTNV